MLTQEEIELIKFLLESEQSRELIEEYIEDGNLPASYESTYDQLLEKFS